MHNETTEEQFGVANVVEERTTKEGCLITDCLKVQYNIDLGEELLGDLKEGSTKTL